MKKNNSSSFALQITILLLLISGGVLIGYQYFPNTINPQLWISVVFFFYVMHILLYFFTINAAKDNSSQFIRRFFGSLSIRLLFSIFFLLGYFIFTKKVEKMFVIYFISVYFIYLVFEIYFLLVNLRPVSNKGSKLEDVSK